MITVRWHYKGRGRVAVESGEDYGNGRRLIREKVVEYEECDDDYDIEYDVDCDEPPPTKKKEKPDNKRYSMMTGSALLRKKWEVTQEYWVTSPGSDRGRTRI